MIDDARAFAHQPTSSAAAHRVLLLAGSPQLRSRSTALLDAVALRLQAQGVAVDRLSVRELPADAVLGADFGDAAIAAATGRVLAADAIVVATPVYKAAYSGVLKAFLDLLPQTALRGKTVLPLATGGSPHHMLALDYALRPVLQSLGARQILPGVYATEAQVVLTPEGAHQPAHEGAYQLAAELSLRIDDAVVALLAEGLRVAPAVPAPTAPGFAPVAFASVRCSV